MGVLALVFCGPVFLGCQQKKSDKKPTQPVFLVSPRERQKLQQSLLRGLRSNARLKCPRPVALGTARTGRGDGALRAVVEPSGAAARCLAYAERHWDDLRRSLFQEPRRPPGGAAGRALPTARPVFIPAVKAGDKPTPGFPEPAIVQTLCKRCGSLPALVERAVTLSDACSPYLPGRRRSPKLGSVLQLHLAVVALARRRFRASPRQAVGMLLRTLALGQDLCRGGTAWIWPQVARLGMLDVVATVARMLAANRLSPAALRSLRMGLKGLRAAEPDLTAHLLGERQQSELQRYLIPMMPRKWIPPGGQPLKARGAAPPAGASSSRFRSISGSIRQDLLVAWVASRRYGRRLADGCRDAASGWYCLQAVRQAEKRVLSNRARLRQQWRALSRRLARSGSGFDRAATREAVVKLLVGLHAPNTSGYLLQAAQRGFYLAALALHVDVLIAARRSGWPELSTVAAWSKARRDPFRGAPLRLEAHGSGFELRPAESLTAVTGGAVVRYVIPGPGPGAGPASRSPATPPKSGRAPTAAPPGPRPRTK